MGRVRLVLLGCATGLMVPWTAAAGPPSTSGACPRAADAARLRVYGPSVRGDVDGDGHPDRVWISGAPAAPWSCGIFLVARTRRTVAAIRVPGDVVGPAGTSLRQGVPRLYALLRLGRDRDLQPVLIVDRAPHAVSLAVYRLWRDRLVQMTLPGPGEDVFDWDTGSRSSGGVDCVGGPGSRRLSRYVVKRLDPGRRWYLDRRTYRIAGSRFTLERAFQGFVPKKPQPLSALPFGRCRGVRAGG